MLSRKEKSLLNNEINILPMLHHKNIAKCIEVLETKTHIHIVMERITGGELYEFLKKKKSFSEFETCYIVFQLLSALVYLHKRGIMHRDIKPENILLELDNTNQNIATVKLADFGLSHILLPGMLSKECCGSPAYVAPEILKKKGYTYQVDIWGLGIIAFLLY